MAEFRWNTGLFSRRGLTHHHMKMGSKGGKQKRLKLERMLSLGFEESGMQAKEGGFIVHVGGT